MFDNIGGKIKSIAKIVCYIEIVGCIIAGIVMMFQESFLTGLAIAFFGSAAAWLASMTTYGFGQLIENTDQLVAQGGGNAAVQNTKGKSDKAQRNKALKNLLEKGLITEEEYQERSK